VVAAALKVFSPPGPALSALAGSAAAFSPMMSMGMDRRQIVQAGAAATVAAPILRVNPAAAKYDQVLVIFLLFGLRDTKILWKMKWSSN